MAEVPMHYDPFLIVGLSPSLAFLGVSPPKELAHDREAFLLAGKLTSQKLTNVNRVFLRELVHSFHFHYFLP